MKRNKNEKNMAIKSKIKFKIKRKFKMKLKMKMKLNDTDWLRTKFGKWTYS
jgi:hypothetical protein